MRRRAHSGECDEELTLVDDTQKCTKIYHKRVLFIYEYLVLYDPHSYKIFRHELDIHDNVLYCAYNII